MKNLLIVTPDYPPSRGGVETFVESLAVNLPKGQFNIRVLAGTRTNLSLKHVSTERKTDISVIRIPTFTFKGLDFPRSLLSYRLIWQELKWADIIHLNDVRLFFLSAAIIKLIYRKKLFLTTQGLIFHTNRLAFFKALYMKFFKFCALHLPITVIANGPTDEKYCKLKNIPHQRINLGISLQKWTAVNRNPHKNRFLYFGRIDKNKNLEGLIHSLSIYSKTAAPFELTVCGKGNPELIKELQTKVSFLGIENQVKWVGSVSENELMRYLGEAEFVFVPSLFESFGFTFIEALAAGCTVIAHRNEQFNSIVGNDKSVAYLIDINQPQELIETIVEARRTYLPVNKKAVEFASQFDEKSIIARYSDLFSKQ